MLDLSYLHRRASRVVPERLRTCAVMGVPADEASLAARVLPLGHARRGSVCFVLEEDTARRLLRDPWPCLSGASRAREGLGRHVSPLAYAAWERIGADDCPLYRTRSEDGRASLWLLPLFRLLIYCWNDAARRCPAGPRC